MSNAKLFRTLVLAACTVSILSGCAASAEAGASGTPARQRSSRDLITQEEIMATGTTNLYDAVQRLRPQWISGANRTDAMTGGGTEVVVYQGATNLGGVDALRQIAPGYVASLRWLDASQATNMLPGLGSRRVAGAILITLPGQTAP
ncbi:MAG TPA: hypothetical protein VHG93_13630 [Longimicrobium sp.]|nr:hypothetical protein [Longimicrobium sp.]